ncbi:MAG TPA: TraK family protein [Nitrosospira sp.]
MVDSKKKPRKGAGRVAFLAHLDGIKKMIEAGHPLVSVFEEYESKLSIKSGQFGKYVRKYVKGAAGEQKAVAPVNKKPERAAKKDNFIIDPKSNMEDLL